MQGLVTEPGRAGSARGTVRGQQGGNQDERAESFHDYLLRHSYG